MRADWRAPTPPSLTASRPTGSSTSWTSSARSSTTAAPCVWACTRPSWSPARRWPGPTGSRSCTSDTGTVTSSTLATAPAWRRRAGKRDVEGEPPEETARRELEEEVGVRAGRLQKLAEFYNSPGFSDERSWVFLAVDLEVSQISAHSPEEQEMTVERVPLDEVPMLIRSGRLVDAKSII